MPALDDSTGITIANSVYSSLEDWGLLDLVQAVSADTTNANFGCRNGAAVIFERMIEKDLLYLACRHHIMELIIGAAFKAKMPDVTGPNVPIFGKFRKNWSEMDTTQVQHGLTDLEPELKQEIPNVVKFIKEHLEKQQPRDDYKELLMLSLMFLDAADEPIRLMKPGACHHARWMAKTNYALKIYLLRKPFDLTASEVEDFYSVSKFIVFVYIRAWFAAPLAICAPFNDLQLLKN